MVTNLKIHMPCQTTKANQLKKRSLALKIEILQIEMILMMEETQSKKNKAVLNQLKQIYS